MNHRLRAHVREHLDPRGLTPGTIVHAARIAVLAIGTWSLCIYNDGAMSAGDAAQLALVLGVAVLLAAPRQRGAMLLGTVAIWLTMGEFLAASRTGQFALWRWSTSLAALALIQVLSRVPQMRARARANPWRPIREFNRGSQTGGPGAAWRNPSAVERVPAALADIEGSDIDGRARRIAMSSSRSA